MEAWWAAVREPVEPIGVTELLEALWWLPGPEQAPEDGLVKAMSADPIDVDRLDSAGWVELGLSPGQAASAMRYRQAVGGFRDAEVVGQMRVLPDGWRAMETGWCFRSISPSVKAKARRQRRSSRTHPGRSPERMGRAKRGRKGLSTSMWRTA